MTYTDRIRTAAPRRTALLVSVLSLAALSCKKDVLSPTIATTLAFRVQPSNVMADSSIVPAITVIVEDAAGNLVTGSGALVAISLSANPGGAVLSGSASVSAVNGVVTFPYLSLNRAGIGYTVIATSTGLSSVVSAPFNVGLVTAGSFASVNIGGNSACGVTTAGSGYCWGNNSLGQLGNGSTSNTTTPIKIAGGLTFGSVSAGSLQYFACGLTTAGAAYCWGYNDYGQLGNGSYTNSLSPSAVTGNHTFTALSAGDGGHACAIATGGAAYCWGYNGAGQLGVASIAYSSSPLAVSGGIPFASISAGQNGQTCGVATSGTGYCWGFNAEGELGNGTANSTFVPTAVSGALTFKGISAGFVSTCGVTTAGAAYCWGDNTYGELGNGSTTGSKTPVPVGGGLTFASVSVGDAFACGLTTTGVAYCWGYNAEGQLGNGTAANSPVPVALFGGQAYASISAGYASACAVTPGGAAYCWGDNAFGELGNQSTQQALVPVLVATPP